MGLNQEELHSHDLGQRTVFELFLLHSLYAGKLSNELGLVREENLLALPYIGAIEDLLAKGVDVVFPDPGHDESHVVESFVDCVFLKKHLPDIGEHFLELVGKVLFLVVNHVNELQVSLLFLEAFKVVKALLLMVAQGVGDFIEVLVPADPGVGFQLIQIDFQSGGRDFLGFQARPVGVLIDDHFELNPIEVVDQTAFSRLLSPHHQILHAFLKHYSHN